MLDDKNLQVLPDGQARVDNKNEQLWEQFIIESKAVNNQTRFYLVSNHTKKVLQCDMNGRAITANTNRDAWEALEIRPL